MVTREGGNYGPPFRGERGATQGYSLSPTIFNVVVDSMVRHWDPCWWWNGRNRREERAAVTKATGHRRREGQYRNEMTGINGMKRDTNA